MQLLNLRLPSFLLLSLTLTCYLNACSSVGVDPSSDPVQPSDSNNENEENSNNAGNNEENNANNSNGDKGEGLNNAESEDFLNNKSQGQDNLFGNEGSNNNLLNNKGAAGGNNAKGGNNLGPESNEALINGSDSNDIIATQEGPAAGGTNFEELPATNSEAGVMAPVQSSPTMRSSGGGVVRYVVAGGSSMHDKPQGSVLRSLEQGDHPLVDESGEWSRTSDGFYVPAKSLTPQPVGRAKSRRSWR